MTQLKKILIILFAFTPILLLTEVKASTGKNVIGVLEIGDEFIEVTKLKITNNVESLWLEIDTMTETLHREMHTTKEAHLRTMNSQVKVSVFKDDSVERVFDFVIPSIYIQQGLSGTEIRVYHDKLIEGSLTTDIEMYDLSDGEYATIEWLKSSNYIVYSIENNLVEEWVDSTNKNHIKYPEVENKVFDGWYYDTSYTKPVSYPFNTYTGLIIYAKFKDLIDPVNVVIDNERTIRVERNTKVDLDYFIPANGILTFTGWFLDEAKTEKVDDYIFEDNATVFSDFQPYATFYTEKTTQPHARVMAKNGKLPFIPTAPAISGYEFEYWTDKQGNKFNFETENININIELYGKYKRTTDVVVTVRGDKENYKLNFPANKIGTTVDISKLVTEEMKYKPGNKYIGLYYDLDLETEVDLENFVIPNNDLSLHIVWQLYGKREITFVTGIEPELETMLVTPGNAWVKGLKNPFRLHHAFMGWYVDEELKKPLTVDYEKMSTDLTVYAKWLSNAAVIYFEMNGGNAISPVVSEYDMVINLPFHPPTRVGYVFTGWFRDKLLQDEIKRDHIFTVTSPTTIYAGWAVDENYVPPKTALVDTDFLKIVFYVLLGGLGIAVVGAVFFPKKRRR